MNQSTQNTLISLTDAAVDHIKKTMSKYDDSVGFRLSIKQTGCSGYMYVPEIINEVTARDVKVDTGRDLSVYIDSDCVEMIRGTVLDYVSKTLGMQMLEFNNPNADSLCGCGESFHLKGEASS